MFYTTWCGPCKKLKPIFISGTSIHTYINIFVIYFLNFFVKSNFFISFFTKSAATKLKTEGINGKLALVNCTKETKLAEKFGIKSYPNLKFFGEFETRDVENLREEQEIIDFVKSSTKTSDISIGKNHSIFYLLIFIYKWPEFFRILDHSFQLATKIM